MTSGAQPAQAVVSGNGGLDFESTGGNVRVDNTQITVAGISSLNNTDFV